MESDQKLSVMCDESGMSDRESEVLSRQLDTGICSVGERTNLREMFGGYQHRGGIENFETTKAEI